MNQNKKVKLSAKILCISVIPVLILFLVSTGFTVQVMRSNLEDMVFQNIYSAGRGMELTLTSLDAEIEREEVNNIFDILCDETGFQYTLYMGQEVYATSVFTNGERALDSPLDAAFCDNIMAGNKLESKSEVINHEKYYGIYYPVSQQGETFGVMFVGMEASEIQSLLMQAPTAIIFSSFIVLIISVICGMLITNSIKKALGITNQAVEQLANGDLAEMQNIESVAARTDELGEVVSNVSRLQHELNDIMTEIKNNAGQLLDSEEHIEQVSNICSKAANEISHAIEEISKGSISQAEELETATTQVNDMEAALNDIGQTITQSGDLVHLMMDSSNKTREVFGEFMKVNEQTTQSINNINQQINATADASNKIVEAVEMINDIAAQTSLLSLNASIEAARAGEAGRGFAVVADEIKKLSEQSASSAQDIREVITELTEENRLNIEMSNDLKVIIEKQTGIMQDSVKELEQLLDYIDKTKTSFEVIGSHNEKITDAKTVLVSTIMQLSAISEQNAAASEETTASMEELNANINVLSDATVKLHNMADELGNSISFFSIDSDKQ